MSNTLLPCPFCGGEAVLTQEDCLGYYNDTWMVFCEACDLYIRFAKQYTKEEAIAAWNRRADAVPVVRCGECKHAKMEGLKC